MITKLPKTKILVAALFGVFRVLSADGTVGKMSLLLKFYDLFFIISDLSASE